MRLQVTAPLGGNSRIQIKKDPVDWMVVQPTGLIVQNQAETPDFENPGNWIN
jgi:hypothetical protein